MRRLRPSVALFVPRTCLMEASSEHTPATRLEMRFTDRYLRCSKMLLFVRRRTPSAVAIIGKVLIAVDKGGATASRDRRGAGVSTRRTSIPTPRHRRRVRQTGQWQPGDVNGAATIGSKGEKENRPSVDAMTVRTRSLCEPPAWVSSSWVQDTVLLGDDPRRAGGLWAPSADAVAGDGGRQPGGG
jgi:hypothetical protein